MIPIFKPYMPQKVMEEIEKTLYSDKLAYGKYGKQFELEISTYIGNEKFISTTTYNYALLIILSALGLSKGDEIIASPVSCLASNQPFAIKGLKINWVDVDPLTGSICLDDLRKKITNKTKAVFVNYYCGYVGRAKEIYDLVKQYGLPVIDDAIEAFGSLDNNNMVGNLYADATVFSFQTVRLPNTIDGGGISFKNESLYKKAILIRDYGITRENFRDTNNEISKECDIKLEGYGALMSEVNAIVGCKQIPHLTNLISKQRENARAWDDLIQNMAGILPLMPIENTIPNYWVYGMLVKDKLSAILKFKEKGFYATGVHVNNNIYSVFQNKKELKGVNDFMNSFVAIPAGWWVNEEQIRTFRW
jgi:dTDP-4-amino-4,6-dideoxygalactose transaminase